MEMRWRSRGQSAEDTKVFLCPRCVFMCVLMQVVWPYLCLCLYLYLCLCVSTVCVYVCINASSVAVFVRDCDQILPE